jgi:O-antigen/teichoic acid export membrane protein
MAVGLFVGIWVARYLGPDKFGLLSYAMAFAGLFASISTLGLDGIVVRELVKDESKRDKLIGTAFWLKLFGGFAVLLILAIAVIFTSNDAYTNLLVFIIASATIFQSFNVVDLYFQAKVLSKYVVYANIISLFLSSIFKITLILYDAPLIAFAWAVLFDSVVLAAGFIYFYYQNKLSFKEWKFEKSIALDLIKDSWPLVLRGIVISVYMRIDQVMIKELMNNEAVGQYAAAVRLSEAWYFIPMIVSSSLFPAIINSKKQSEGLYQARLQNLYTLAVWIAIAIALPMTFLSDWVVNILYGVQYDQAGGVLMIHIWAGVFVSFGSIWSKHMLANNKQKVFLSYDITSTVLNVIINLILIPFIGIMGAAIATAFSMLITYIFFGIFYHDQKETIKYFIRAILLTQQRRKL